MTKGVWERVPLFRNIGEHALSVTVFVVEWTEYMGDQRSGDILAKIEEVPTQYLKTL